jgi:hypothetical protein
MRNDEVDRIADGTITCALTGDIEGYRALVAGLGPSDLRGLGWKLGGFCKHVMAYLADESGMGEGGALGLWRAALLHGQQGDDRS